MNTYPLYKSNHVEEAKSFLPMQFKGRENLNKLFEAIVEQVQELEDVFRDVYLCKLIDNASGKSLDAYGEIAGYPRGVLTDSVYRNRIKGQIIANRSSGQIDTILDYVAVQGECFVIKATELPGYIYLYIVNNFDFDDNFFISLQKMVSAGVRLDVGHVITEHTPLVLSENSVAPEWGDGFSVNGTGGGYFATLLIE